MLASGHGAWAVPGSAIARYAARPTRMRKTIMTDRAVVRMVLLAFL
jgi:hypothetical protein